MKRFSLALSILLICAAHAFAGDDDDDGSVGLFVRSDFEIVQGQVFHGRWKDGVRAWGENANLLISGGEITGDRDGLDVHFGAQVTITGGSITGADDGVKVKADSQVTVTGGTIHGADDGISAVDDSRIEITGGSISGGVFGLLGIDRAAVDISGGTVSGPIEFRDQSTFTISGGEVDSITIRNDVRLKILGGQFNGSIEAGDNSVVAIFRGRDGDLFRGGRLSNVSDIGQSRVFDYLTAVDEDTTINSRSNSAIGVVDGADGQPTSVELTADGELSDLYLAEHSTAVSSGLLARVTIDDESTFSMLGGEITRGILAIGNGTLDLTAGVVDTRRTDGLQLRGTSQSKMFGGEIRSDVDGIDMTSSASLSIYAGTVSAGDDGVRLEDNATLTVFDGVIHGNDEGISAADSTVVHVSGGSVEGNTFGIRATNDASISVAGGIVRNNVSIKGSSSLELSGGEILSDVIVDDSTVSFLSGGEIHDDLRAYHSATIVMSGSVIHGDFEARDDTRIEVTGGNVLTRIHAQEKAIVRLFGIDLHNTNGLVTGSMMDGTMVETPVLALDEARIVAYNAETAERTVDESLEGNVAVYGDGPVVHVDFHAGSVIGGELLVSDDGRANIFGGTINGPIVALRSGLVAFYGSGLIAKASSENAARIVGTLFDGTTIDHQLVFEDSNPSQVRLFEVIHKDTQLTEDLGVNLALLENNTAGIVVNYSGQGNDRAVDVRGDNTFNMQGGYLYSPEFAVSDRGVINVSDGDIQGYDDGIFAQDSATVRVSGGYIAGSRDGVRVWDSSMLNMDGGTIHGYDDGVDAKHLANVEVAGGMISGSDNGIRAKGESSILLTNGAIFGDSHGVSLSDASDLLISGGEVTGYGAYGVYAADNSSAEIRGGQLSGGIGAVFAADSSVVEIFGGNLNGDLYTDGGIISVFGSNLALDGTHLTGLLEDGTMLDVQVFAEDGGQFVLTGILDRVCDFNGDGACNLTDIDVLLYDGLQSGNTRFDLDGSGSVDLADRDTWFIEADRLPGDFDFSGSVDSDDLNALGINWLATDLTSYGQGDTNGDHIADSFDLNVLGINWLTGITPQAVPESNGAVAVLVGVGILMACRRRSMRARR